jgi:hypothetical protein
MSDRKIATNARANVQKFAQSNVTKLDGTRSIVPATTFLAVEAFGLACAAYANESGQEIDECIEEFIEGMKTAGAECARKAHAFICNVNAENRAENTTKEIMARLRK